MLDKRSRLRKKEDMDRVFRQGKPLFFALGVCLICPSGSGKHAETRFGFSFKTKIFPRSVDRHRMKRVLAEAVSKRKVYYPEGMDVVFLCNKPVRTRPNLALALGIVDECLQKIPSINTIKK